MKDKKRFPSSGGSYTRTADGKLKPIEKPTAPSPGKRALRAEAAAKAAAEAAAKKTPAKTAATSEKARG